MKKKSLLACLAFTLCASSISLAQTQQQRKKITSNYDVAKSSILAKKVQTITKENYDRAMLLAKKHNWPLTIDFEDGGFGELVGVIDGDTPMYNRTFNKGGVSTIYADKVHSGGSAGLDLNGENMTVGVWDGNTVRLSHELFEDRAFKMDNITGFHNHSTHVTGTIIGSAEFEDGEAIGVAPKAEAHTYDWNNDYEEMVEEAEEGLLVSNHSYGAVSIDNFGNPLLPVSFFGQYNFASAIVDEIAYEFEYYLPVWAAGNDRDYYQIINPDKGGYDLLTKEGNSKNNITVGSIHGVFNYTDPKFVRLSSFTNFGPTDDGRIKPDITAKGHNVYSAVAANDTIYGVMNGTSMAAPSVTGGVALLQQHANEENGDFYRSATIRGLIAHTATKAGAEGNPNYRYGWGIMNVAGAVDVITNNGDSTLIKETKLTQGENYSRIIKASEVKDLIATIAWTDLPGTPTSSNDDRTPVLVNDLDIRLTSLVNDEIYYPFILDPEQPEESATTGDNFRDNIEKIELINPEGDYILSVTHKKELEEEEQKFSLILSGIVNNPLTFETYQNNQYVCSGVQEELSIELLVDIEEDIENTVITVEDIPQGTNATIDDSNLADGVVILHLSDIETLSPDTYTLKLTAVNGSEEAVLYPDFVITDDEFTPIITTTPEEEEYVNKRYIAFEWEVPSPENRILSYTLELAYDNEFTDIVDTIEDIETNRYFYNGLELEKEYYWRVKAIGQCAESEYSDVVYFHTDKELSIQDHHIDSFVVHPNPATNKVVIDSPTLIKEVKVLNILGQEVMTSNPNTDSVQLDISGLPTGTYLLRISDDEASIVKKLIKK